MEILNNHISDRVFCNKINKSQYLQIINKTKDTHILYPNIIELLFTYFDHHYSMVESKDKDLYIKQRIIEIATKLEEDSSNYYSNFNYNKKMSIPVIQHGLQTINTVSALLYLADLYNISVIVYLKGGNKKIITSVKNRKIFHLLYTPDGKWYTIDKVTEELENYIDSPISELSECLVLDVTTKDIYVRFLGGIGNYKASELIKMATERNIQLFKNGKKKVKKDLYDDINLYELNKSL
jgi:hypothetical protein